MLSESMILRNQAHDHTLSVQCCAINVHNKVRGSGFKTYLTLDTCCKNYLANPTHPIQLRTSLLCAVIT